MTETTGSMLYKLIGLLCMYYISDSICQIEYTDRSFYSLIISFIHMSHSLHFRTYISFIISGYSYYVHMLVTRLKSDMCLVFLLHN